MVSLLPNNSKFSDGKELAPNEVSHLLDISRDPSLLISSTDHKIFAVNAPAAELTGYTRQELTELHLETLLPKLSDVLDNENQTLELHSRQGVELDLISRRKKKIPIRVTVSRLGESKRFSIFRIISREKNNPNSRYEEKALAYSLSDLEKFADILHQTELDEALEILGQLGLNLLSGSSFGLYTISSNHPKLQAIWLEDPDNLLPETISTSDFFTYYKEPLYAPPFKPPLSPLMERAAETGASFIAAAPLGDDNSISGVLVLMGSAAAKPHPKNFARSVMQLLVSTSEGILRTFIRKSNLSDRLSDAALKKTIGDTINKFMPDGVLYLNPELKIQQVNPSAEQILGYAEQEIISRHIDDVVIGTDRLTPALQDALEGIPTHDLGHLEIHHRDGSAFPAIIKTFPVESPDSSRVQGIIIFIQDISKEEKVRIQTQQLERRALVGQMNAIFAHEIRNPINNITSGIQLLDKTLPEDFKHRPVLQGISDDCDRLTHIVDTVLTFSKSQSYHRTPTLIAPLIEKILNRWQPRMKRTDVSHVMKVEENVPQILGDPRALGQVFNNLISNAVRAMEETGGGVLSVRIRSFERADGTPGVQIDVLDTGPGIPAEVQEHIFEPFFTTKPDGTGLGLSITKQIITMHEGTIKLVPLPEGTSFQIVLPGKKEEK